MEKTIDLRILWGAGTIGSVSDYLTGAEIARTERIAHGLIGAALALWQFRQY
jgi:hypothetical protein